VQDGGGNARIELEFATKDEKAKIFNVDPLQGGFNILSGKLVAPGDPYRSVLLYRISKLGRGRMPHLGSQVVDERAVSLIHDWIAAMPTADDPAPPAAVTLRNGNRKALESLKSGGVELQSALKRLLSTPSGSLMLLDAVGEQSLPADVTQTVVAAGTAHGDVYVRDLFERFLPEEQRVKRLGNVFNPRMILALSGDAKRGESFFFQAAGVQCRNCHKIQDKGRDMGPDLSHVRKKLTREKILESIINPSKAIDEKFATYLIETTAGRVLTGLLIKQDDREVVLKDPENKVLQVPREEIEFMVIQQKSLMPELLLRDVTAQQAADLLEYLCTLK
jgi:putative heme-binding domain-containing protein